MPAETGRDQVLGEYIDPQTGMITGSGVKLTPKHLGATILALADIDPFEHLGTTPIKEVLE